MQIIKCPKCGKENTVNNILYTGEDIHCIECGALEGNSLDFCELIYGKGFESYLKNNTNPKGICDETVQKRKVDVLKEKETFEKIYKKAFNL